MEKKISKRFIAEYLDLWFSQNQENNQLWSKDVIGVIIKQNLIQRGNWKKALSNCGQNKNSLNNLIKNKPNS
jgi:hypothetical protein